jgi:UDP-2-acetamido-3-amino-2,3-dideoxy-glucuronate N-acetyltransferase
MSYTAHPSAVIDEGCQIGDGTRIWHFTHIMTGATIGKNCKLGQTVAVSPRLV